MCASIGMAKHTKDSDGEILDGFPKGQNERQDGTKFQYQMEHLQNGQFADQKMMHWVYLTNECNIEFDFLTLQAWKIWQSTEC